MDAFFIVFGTLTLFAGIMALYAYLQRKKRKGQIKQIGLIMNEGRKLRREKLGDFFLIWK
jgi:hypothetical protein